MPATATVLTLLLTFFTSLYVVFLLTVRKGIRILENNRPSDREPPYPLVTIIIAARNEETTIASCLDAIVRQDYPKQLLELIVVNDGSTDGTVDIVRSYVQSGENVKLIDVPHKESHSKAAAVTQGVRIARGDILLTTDADCAPGQTWVRSIVSHFDDRTALVAGPLLEAIDSGFIARLSRLEFFGLILAAAGLIGVRRPIICNGANLAFRKRAFEKAGGFGNGAQFTEDEALMNRIFERRLGEVKFAASSAALVTTKGPSGLRDFLRQRVRWSAKRNTYEDRTTWLFLVTLYMFFTILLGAGALAFFFPVLWIPVVASLLLKSIAEASVLHAGSGLLGVSFSWLDFLIAELLHVPYIVIAAFVGQFASLSWKGRTLA